MRRLGFPLLAEDVRALVRHAAAIEAAPEGARERVRARVEAFVGSEARREEEPGTRAMRERAFNGPRSSRARHVLGLVASFALGGALGAWVTHRTMYAAPSVRTVVPIRAAPVPETSGASPSRSGRQPSTTGLFEESAAMPSARTIEPSAIASGTAAVRAPTTFSTAGSPTARTPDRATDERALLDVARGAVEREDGTAALAATAEHERRFSRGVLVQEREAIAVRALVLLGRTEEARTRLERFRQTFPNSLLLPALESTVVLPGRADRRSPQASPW
jgi:hypothetical protein